MATGDPGDSENEMNDAKLLEECSDSGDNLKVAHFLTSTFHVVLNILSYLNARQLNSCARVCKLWSKAAKTLKSKRRTRAWTFLSEDEMSDPGNIIFTATRQFLHGLFTEPKVLFMFCNTDFNEAVKINSNTDTSRRTRNLITDTNYGDFIRTLIPESCQMLAVSTSGVVGTSSDLKHVFENQIDSSVALLCLPDYEGFSVIHSRHDENDDVTNGLDTENHISNKIQEHATCKAILNFISEPDVQRSFVFDLKKDFENAVLAGGMVDSLVQLACEEGYPAAMHVALCGQNVDVGCVVIRDNIQTKEKAEDKIKELKNYKLSEENSFAFMFACVGRGEGLWGEKNVETALFRKHFPKTPIIGFFGNGEIGMDHVTTVSQKTNHDSEPFNKKVKKNNKLFHAYTTILVLVSLK